MPVRCRWHWRRRFLFVLVLDCDGPIYCFRTLPIVAASENFYRKQKLNATWTGSLRDGAGGSLIAPLGMAAEEAAPARPRMARLIRSVCLITGGADIVHQSTSD